MRTPFRMVTKVCLSIVISSSLGAHKMGMLISSLIGCRPASSLSYVFSEIRSSKVRHRQSGSAWVQTTSINFLIRLTSVERNRMRQVVGATSISVTADRKCLESGPFKFCVSRRSRLHTCRKAISDLWCIISVLHLLRHASWSCVLGLPAGSANVQRDLIVL